MSASGERIPPLLPLRLIDVSYAAGGKRRVDGVNLTLETGQRTVILGPNGAGKSLLLRLCHGLLQPTSGTIRFNAPDRIHGRRRQAMVFQRPVTLRRSVISNVTYALTLAGMPRAQRQATALRALERVGLAHLSERPARVLSGGEQQRLAIARAWALQPELLLLDEPTANLDPTAAHSIEAAIQAMHEAGTKVVIVTHNLGQAHRLGDEVVFLSAGRLVEQAPMTAFLRSPASAEARSFINGELPWF
jgi:tungstate transport system ATP-binding protein